jgi:sigma-B regulation protein RsbU (phosphoserine phosphatase)
MWEVALMNGVDLDNGTEMRDLSLGTYYGITIVATTIAMSVVILLNLATPLDFFPRNIATAAFEEAPSYGMVAFKVFIIRLLVVFALAYSLTLLSLHVMLRPIASYLQMIKSGQAPAADLLERAQRRLLNLPHLHIRTNVGFWILAPTVVFLSAYLIGRLDLRTGLILSARSCMVGLIASTISFHKIENHSRKKFIPLFFPHGRLYMSSGAARFSIARRIRILHRIGSIVPMTVLVVTLLTLQWEVDSTQISAKAYGRGILTFTLVLCAWFLTASGILNRAATKSITLPLEEIMAVLRGVQNGDYEKQVKVVSNDEIGYTGDIINEMTEGLKERDRMRHSLELAMEIQQSLLPKENPQVDGLDIAGRSIFCDETGGDYYDYILGADAQNARVIVVLGDVSGHGISAALLMSAVRSALRQRASMPGSPAQIITDVNRQMVTDVEDSGEFITMFYLTIEPPHKSIKWVRAGHDRAIFYDPHTGTFDELGGAGIALGVDADWVYAENARKALRAGQIVLLCTDGIWEARNPAGDMYGKEPVYEILRNNSGSSANEILEAIFDSLSSFQQDGKIEDDITVVIIKITGQ